MHPNALSIPAHMDDNTNRLDRGRLFTNTFEGHLCICLYLTITVSVLIHPEMANYHSCVYVINEMIYDVLLDT